MIQIRFKGIETALDTATRKKNLINKIKFNELTQLTVVTTKPAYTKVSLEKLSESTIISQTVICTRQHHENRLD